MNKKGFTMIELIAVITILGIIALITVPVVNNSLKNAREKMFEEQKTRIIDAAKKYALENESIIRTDLDKDYTQMITLNQLKNDNYLEKKDIINPINDEVMSGCVLVKYTISNNKFTYNYSPSCSFSNYYANSADLYYYYTKESFSETTLGNFIGETDDINIYSEYADTKVTIYDDGKGFLFDKNGNVLTLYIGIMMEAENTSTLLEIYRILYEQASSGNDEEYSEDFDSYDIYIDDSQNIILMVIDIVKEFGSQNLFEGIPSSNLDSIEDICDVLYSDEDDCINTIGLKRFKLDN